MAAVTVNSSSLSVFGDRSVVVADVSIANNGDTWVSGLSTITAVVSSGGSAAVTRVTKSGGTVTFVTGGAVNNAYVMAVGFQ